MAATIVDEWVRAGVTDAVVAPGSRSTPLIMALAGADIRIHVHIDERSAGFFALGLAVATGRPAPVVTTSGSAVGHLLPAAIEAHEAGVPMLLCTADRPPELHHVGAPQTIEQTGIFGVFADLALVLDESVPAASWRSIAARTVGGPGVVHLNVAFRDPLVAEPGGLTPAGRPGGRPWSRVTRPPTPQATLVTPVAGRTGIIVATAGISEPATVVAAAAALGWPILAGPRSGLRGVSTSGAVMVSAFDGVLRHSARAAALAPEVVIRLGGLPASKVANAWLDALEADQVVVDPGGRWTDPGRTASELVVASPEAVCRGLMAGGAAAAPDGWAVGWRTAEGLAQQTIESVLGRHEELTEPGVARRLTHALAPDVTLLVASSMPIRDVEWYGDPAMTARVVANRGANGIDGLVSTALGVAASGAPTVALLGDLAFLHDSGGLLNAAAWGVMCTFVVIDNRGGGIFSFLPQADLDPATFERFWGTPHAVDIPALCAAHGVPAALVETPADLASALAGSVAAGGVRVLVVRTDRAANVAVHEELVGALHDALD